MADLCREGGGDAIDKMDVDNGSPVAPPPKAAGAPAPIDTAPREMEPGRIEISSGLESIGNAGPAVGTPKRGREYEPFMETMPGRETRGHHQDSHTS